MSFDLSDEAWEASLPKTGIHNATIVNARVIRKDTMTLLLLVFEVVGEQGKVHHIEDFPVVDGPESSSRLAQGKGRVKAILKASGKSISFASVDHVPASLIGCRVSIVVGRRIKDGLGVPSVDSIEGPASEAGLSSQAAE